MIYDAFCDIHQSNIILFIYTKSGGKNIEFRLNEDIIETRVILYTFQLNSGLRRQLHVS